MKFTIGKYQSDFSIAIVLYFCVLRTKL